MTDKLHFNLVSPECELASGEADQIDIPGTEGWIGILPGHAPVMTTLKPGIVVVTPEGGADRRIFVRGGFADVNETGLTLLAEHAENVENVDMQALDQSIRDAEEDVADAETAETKTTAQHRLDQFVGLHFHLGLRQRVGGEAGDVGHVAFLARPVLADQRDPRTLGAVLAFAGLLRLVAHHRHRHRGVCWPGRSLLGFLKD